MAGGALSELERRVSELIRIGVISEVQPEKGLCRVSFGKRVSPLSPWFALHAGEDRDFWAPSVGEQAVFFSPYGDGSEGVVLPGIFSNKVPVPEGAREGVHITEYGHGLRIERDGKKGVISITGSLHVSGKVIDGEGNTNHHSHNH
jgi:phage baseplate assembly protein V